MVLFSFHGHGNDKDHRTAVVEYAEETKVQRKLYTSIASTVVQALSRLLQPKDPRYSPSAMRRVPGIGVLDTSFSAVCMHMSSLNMQHDVSNKGLNKAGRIEIRYLGT